MALRAAAMKCNFESERVPKSLEMDGLWMNCGCAVKALDADFPFALAGLGDVVGRLHPHEGVHLDAESLFDAQRHIAGQGRLEVE